MTQLSFLAQTSEGTTDLAKRRSGAFTDNMKLPVHRWFRYSAGFSAEWVEQVIANHSNGVVPRVLDPFCGSGTTLIAAAKAGADSVGFETHRFVARIAAAKLDWRIDLKGLDEVASRVVRRAEEMRESEPQTTSPLILKCYDPENLTALESLRTAYAIELENGVSDELGKLIWLAITCILRECSGVGTAQWQYVLPNKSKARVSDPYSAFRSRVNMIRNDLLHAQVTYKGTAAIIQTDARNPECDDIFDLVITSPPYPNNYDYADATRLEMTFWEEIASWGDLQNAVRQYLIRSCSQHSAAEHLLLADLLNDDAVDPIKEELAAVCYELDEVRQGKGGKKSYHTMVAAYFADLAKVWISLRKLTRAGAKVGWVIGDSAPYGVYVPCEEWLGRLALAAGFEEYSFEKIRDRNMKWKNRKHRVPLKEGVLWVEG